MLLKSCEFAQTYSNQIPDDAPYKQERCELKEADILLYHIMLCHSICLGTSQGRASTWVVVVLIEALAKPRNHQTKLVTPKYSIVVLDASKG